MFRPRGTFYASGVASFSLLLNYICVMNCRASIDFNGENRNGAVSLRPGNASPSDHIGPPSFAALQVREPAIRQENS